MTGNCAVAHYFDRHAVRYDEIVSNVDFQLNDGYRYLADYLRFAASDQDQLRVLELGIGTGKLTRYLLESDPRISVTGVDASARMLAKAEDNLGQYGKRLQLLCSDFSAETLPAKKYDFVVSAIALTFYTIDHQQLFRNIHHRLNRNGLFVYAANVTQNTSSAEQLVSRMLVQQLKMEQEQARWLRDIKGGPDTDIFMASAEWHANQLRMAGFYDADCIYLRYKLGVFSAQKPGSAI